MSEFQFQKSQRVTVPADAAGAADVQGVVVGDSSRLGREPLYVVQWQSTDTVDEQFTLKACEEVIAESRLLAAQPASTIPKAEAAIHIADAYRRGADDLRSEQDLERIHRATKRKRVKPVAKRKRR